MADLTKDRVRAIVREEVLSRTRPRTPPMVRAIFAPVESVDLIGALVEALPVLEEHACRLADAVRDLLEREAVERLREVAPIADTTGMEGRLAEALRRRVQACRCDGSDPACAADRALLAERTWEPDEATARWVLGVLRRASEPAAPGGEVACDYCCGVGACPRCWGRAAVSRLAADNARLKEERAAALSVTTREGLLASEWVLRTGLAERERDRLAARVAELEAAARGREGK